MSDYFKITYKLKDFFFDRAPVKKAVEKAGLGFLSKSLGAIRKIVRNSMKPATKSRKIAPQGKPPLYHTRDLKDRILYALDPSKLGGVVGPVRFKRGVAPRLLEFGGTTTGPGGKTMHYRGNSYMAPALEKERPNMPKRWQGSVRTG